MAIRLEILEAGKDGSTGHMTVMARIIDDTDKAHGTGAVEIYGIESMELQSKYSGDVGKWLHWVSRQMHHKHCKRAAAHVELAQWKGKTIDIA